MHNFACFCFDFFGAALYLQANEASVRIELSEGEANFKSGCRAADGAAAALPLILRKGESAVKKKAKYTNDLPKRLYTFFISQADTNQAPSFQKFARSIGATASDIEEFRKHSEFDRSYKECSEIRRDYLIDSALSRRYDPSFTKFLLACEFGMGEKEKEKEDTELSVTLEVLTDVSDES